MSQDALKRAAAALDEASRRELLTFLVSLREQQWALRFHGAASRPDSEREWLTPEEFERRLHAIPEPTDG
jgi:hypothetical protein